MTVLAFIGGLGAPVAVLVAFNKVAVKLSLPTIIDALMESAPFQERMAVKLAKDPAMADAMKGAADHKGRNVQAGLEVQMNQMELRWRAELTAQKQERERDRQEDRDWRRTTSKQIDRIFELLRHLDRADAKNQGRHESMHDDEPSEVPS